MCKYILLIWIFLNSVFCYSQFIINGDFETYSSLPQSQGQVSRCLYWDEVIQSADYLNSSFNGWCSQIGAAYSGSGYMGVGTYGDSIGSAEAIGQDISVMPLNNADTFNVGLYSKQSLYDCGYNQKCGGISIYGYTSPPTISNAYIHAKDLQGAYLLWSSNIILDSNWTFFSGQFIAPNTINYIVVTNDHSPNCQQYLFIDSLFIEHSINKTLSSESKVDFPNVFTPNSDGENDFFYCNCSNVNDFSCKIYNRWGAVIYEFFNYNNVWDGYSLSGLPCSEGTYFFVSTYVDSSGALNSLSGTVTLLR